MVSRPFGFDYPQLLLGAFALCVVVVLVVAVGTSTASFGVFNADWDGASGLRDEASAVGAESEIVRNTTRYTTASANGTIAIVLSPETSYEPESTTRLRRFVRDGGTLLVADDRPSEANRLLADLGVRARLDGRTLRDDRYNYRSPALVVVQNVSERPLTRDVDQLTLNYGTALNLSRSEVPGPNRTAILANTSAFAYLDTNSNGEIDGNESLAQYPVATAEPVGEGRIVVVSDPSVFVNAMLDRPDNRAFLHALLSSHERVLIDYSHAARLPPLAVATLTIRDSPALQLLFGGIALCVVGLWGRRPWWLRRPIVRLRETIGRRDASDSPAADVGEAEIAAFVAKRHPDWDAERVQRVTREVIMQQHNGRNND